MRQRMRKRIIESGGKCPACQSKIYAKSQRRTDGGRVFQTHESPLHRRLKQLTAGALALEFPEATVKTEYKIKQGESRWHRCDVVALVPNYRDWHGVPAEILVDNMESVDAKMEFYEENGFTPIRVYPRDEKPWGLDIESVFEREIPNY